MRGLLCVLPVLAACKVKEPPPARDPFADSFERAEVGSGYQATGPGYAIKQGALSARGAHNHPLWLARRIPRDAKIELDCWSTEKRGDLKIELWGDGHSFDPDGGAYTATGYELIFGGWYNTKSIIARLDEHGTEMAKRTDIKVVAGKKYHWRIERKGKTIKWFVDEKLPDGRLTAVVIKPAPKSGSGSAVEAGSDTGSGSDAGSGSGSASTVPPPSTEPFLQYDDPRPLEGVGHDYLGFNNWETDTWFDNLVITPL